MDYNGEQLYTSPSGVMNWDSGLAVYVWTKDHILYNKIRNYPVEVEAQYLSRDDLCSEQEFVIEDTKKARIIVD